MTSLMNANRSKEMKWMTVNKHDIDEDGSDYLDLRSFMDVSDCPQTKRVCTEKPKGSGKNDRGLNESKVTWHQAPHPEVSLQHVTMAVPHAFVGIKIGDEFSTHEELLERIQRVQIESNVQLNRDQSTSLDKAHRKIPLRAIKTNPELKFTSIIYTCKFGGKKHIAAGSGQRQRKTLKRGCPARIRFTLTDNCQKLIVKDMIDEHNHEVDKTIYDHLPRQRKLSDDTPKITHHQRTGKEELHLHSHKTLGKEITLRDLSNIDVSLELSSRDDVLRLCQRLRSISGSIVHVDEDVGTLKGIFFQDSMMQKVFAAYPELLLFDASYSLPELGMSLYMMMTVDGNGFSEIVAIYLAASESESSVRSMVKIFKHHNQSWSGTKVFIIDRDKSKQNILREEFPEATLQLCLFHTLRLFKLEFTKVEMEITSGERDALLNILGKMAHSSTEADFSENHQRFLRLGLYKAIDYFSKNWLPFKDEWVTVYKNKYLNLGVRTNNRLGSLGGKLENMCSRVASLDAFFTEFLAISLFLRSERNRNAIFTSLKSSSKKDPDLSPEDEMYRSLLTPHAFEAVEKQMKLRYLFQIPVDGQCRSSSSGVIQVTPTSCQCTFYTSMKLPCQHIFAIRERDGLCSYDPALPANRWRADLFASISGGKIINRTVCPALTSTYASNSATSQNIQNRTATEKYREALEVTTKLARIASKVGMAKFEERIAFLKSVLQCWEDGDTPVLAISSAHGFGDEPLGSEEESMMETRISSDGAA